MTILTFLLQAVASLLAIITFLIVLNVQRSMLIPGGVLGMAIWLLYLLLKGPTNVIIATFVAAIIGSCVSQILSIIYKTPAVWSQATFPIGRLPSLSLVTTARL